MAREGAGTVQHAYCWRPSQVSSYCLLPTAVPPVVTKGSRGTRATKGGDGARVTLALRRGLDGRGREGVVCTRISRSYPDLVLGTRARAARAHTLRHLWAHTPGKGCPSHERLCPFCNAPFPVPIPTPTPFPRRVTASV
jgi:hypothetical protein